MWMMPSVLICLEEDDVVNAFQVSASKSTYRSEETYVEVPPRSCWVNMKNANVVVNPLHLCLALVQYNLLYYQFIVIWHYI